MVQTALRAAQLADLVLVPCRAATFDLEAIKTKDDVTGFGLSLAQLKAQSHALDLLGNLAAFQRVPGPPPTEVFFRNALDNCDLPILTPSRASIFL